MKHLCALDVLSMSKGRLDFEGKLGSAIRDDPAANNRNPKPFVRTKPADAILESSKRFCMRISNSEY
ncbi:hypothetical protein B2A_10563 [mine drainage metagenome]|uniref:Uncharacterized protein n=1 Tax=mine drainage metagenome TaxID=410659 RepID=T0ZC33_9ZZZZ